MLSLKWGDVLSILLPGAVALFAVAPYFPSLANRMDSIDKAGAAMGLVLLIAATLAGGVLEALTRITWEPWWLKRRCPIGDALSNLSPDNLELYERGVQSSYKYVTFYANFAWATLLLLLSHLHHHAWKVLSIGNAILLLAIVILLRASHMQWKYYVNYQRKIFERSKIC